MKDFGYDVADYTDVDPLFGTLADFDALIAEAHRLGIKVIIDQVLSHTSDQHPWFRESRASRDNPKADWYVWADAKPDGTPPNNWLSIFGGSAWEWDTRRLQYYLHNFLVEQPDLNFHSRRSRTRCSRPPASGSSAAPTASASTPWISTSTRRGSSTTRRRGPKTTIRPRPRRSIPTACRTISTTRASPRTSASCSACARSSTSIRRRPRWARSATGRAR